MANHASAEKRVRRNEKRAVINTSRRSAIRTLIKKVETAIAEKDSAAAKAAFIKAQPAMQRGVTKGIMPKNTMSRKLSRLSARIKAI